MSKHLCIFLNDPEPHTAHNLRSVDVKCLEFHFQPFYRDEIVDWLRNDKLHRRCSTDQLLEHDGIPDDTMDSIGDLGQRRSLFRNDFFQ